MLKLNPTRFWKLDFNSDVEIFFVVVYQSFFKLLLSLSQKENIHYTLSKTFKPYFV